MATSMGEEAVREEMKSMEAILSAGSGFFHVNRKSWVFIPLMRVAGLEPTQICSALVTFPSAG